MFYNLKITLRNLRRGGIYSTINIVGLAVSLTTVICIMLWVQDELSFDKFHKRSKDIFQTNLFFKNTNNYWNIACAPLAFTAKEEIPEIENACRCFTYGGADMLKYDGKGKERIVTGFTYGVVDSTFFSIFDFPVLDGDAGRMLVDPQSIVLSENIAKQLFGNEPAIGKTLFDNNRKEYHVTGVMADMPQNSSIRFDILFPFSLFELSNANQLSEWSRFDFRTWFLLRPGANMATVEKKLNGIQYRNTQNDEVSYKLQPYESINFRDPDGTANSKMQVCRLFMIVAFVVILIACVNYVNISTARASRRNKEVFVKNILGARKAKLFIQFLNESVLLFLIALVIATVLLYIIFPVFNHVTEKQLTFNLFSTQTFMVYGLTFLTVVLCAGIYPAINLAVKKPLQGIRNKSENAVVRRMLVVSQFIVAIVLITVTIVTTLQLEYARKKDLGYQKENVFRVRMTNNLRIHYEAIKSELLQNTAVSGVTATSMSLNKVTTFDGISNIEGSDPERQKIILLVADKDFIPTMNVQLVAGKNFTGMSADASSIILNETAVKTLDIKDPVGKRCNIAGMEAATIIGVAKDFHFKDLHTPIEPLAITTMGWLGSLYVKTSANSASQAIPAVEKLWKQYESELPFSYQFVDDEFDATYKTDIRTGILFRYFAIIAILISCLGLFGLVTFTAETKTKEIGIRKVLGASVRSIVNMLSKEFLILVGIAMLLAFPLTYYWVDKMLQDFAYRIRIGWWMFALAGLITIGLTLVTVGWQAIKAATANPVKAIKSE